MTSVFLSYARGDEAEPYDPATSFAARLHHNLQARGIDVWFDRVDMPSRSLTFHQEIIDAISARDRLLLVVGPNAATSAYVRQEWQFAYFQADKVVTPILRQGDFPLVPDELKLLHCEDFRNEAQYAFHLDNLARQLREPPPPLGKLIAVPSLPAHFLSRTERLTAGTAPRRGTVCAGRACPPHFLGGPWRGRGGRHAVRADLDGPVVIGGTAVRVGMHGMGGIGKSVLAAALAHDRKVREAFPDGIVWVGLGSLPAVVALQRRVHADLGGDGAFQTEHEGRVKLKELLAGKRVLLILDDAWRRSDVDAFDVLGPRCRAMITTRDTGLLTSLGGVHHVVELLTDQEALNILAQSAGVDREHLPAEASQIIAECGRLPLAVALCGGMIRRGLAPSAVLLQLQQARIDRIADRHAVENQHQSVWHAIHVSVEFLPADERRRFLELAAFPPDEAIPEAAIETLWAHTGQLDDWQTQELLVTLGERSLIQLVTQPSDMGRPPRGRASLHTLVYHYVQRAVPDVKALQERLLAGYQARCNNGWPSGPNDGYYFNHLRTHLIAAGRAGELVDLLHELRWLEAKNEAALTFDLTADFRDALGAIPADDSRRKILRLLDEALRRDIHFIARHATDYPQALFQCLWNTAWWYDTPEAAQHYEPPPGGSPTEGPPWQLEGPKLSHLLEQWKQAKESRQRALRLLRSLRPPAQHLGTTQLAVFRGHTDAVNSVAYSPYGARIVSGADDKTLRVWDAQRGAELAVLCGHDNRVSSVAYSPDGRRIVSGSWDETLRVWDGWPGGSARKASLSLRRSPSSRQGALRSRPSDTFDSQTGYHELAVKRSRGVRSTLPSFPSFTSVRLPEIRARRKNDSRPLPAVRRPTCGPGTPSRQGSPNLPGKNREQTQRGGTTNLTSAPELPAQVGVVLFDFPVARMLVSVRFPEPFENGHRPAHQWFGLCQPVGGLE